ncbi:esterase [Devosia soli]|uniref:Esterase n=1 Tax=Devosia soli TaxID=361041 RepID=A0A0F5LH03_9HYPH|nr:serine hydrolase [Devosia soli]KKB80857.1 esterase [Devosia soli]
MATEAPDPALDQVFETAFSPVRRAIEDKRIPGAVFGVVDLKRGRRASAAGLAQIVPDKREMTLDTWFDLASLTKVLFTTPRILQLAEEGRIDLDAPLTSVIPDFRQYEPGAWERKVTFRQCLGHQTAFPASVPIFTYGDNPKLLRHFVLQHPWIAGPSAYSDINFILLGIALERLEGRSIREMDAGEGFAFAGPRDRTAATENCPWRGRVLVGEVHDENCFALEGAGNAGLFGTATALLDRALELLETKNQPVVQLMRTRLAAHRTHGWECANLGWSGGDTANAETIGHTGFTGTGLWIDFARDRAWTLLTNRVHPSRWKDSGIFALRRQVADIINAA